MDGFLDDIGVSPVLTHTVEPDGRGQLLAGGAGSAAFFSAAYASAR